MTRAGSETPLAGRRSDAAIETYLDPAALPYAFCPGCSHGRVVDQLNAALVSLQLDPRRVVIVTDIGCAGIADRYLATNALHGLHGRSVTYATGIKLARPELKVIVLIGDGGCGIGGHHLINAARRNVGITVLVFNNLNFGMTGGQYSVTTPTGRITATSPQGLVERPMDIAGTVALNGAAFAARTTAFDPGLAELIARAIQTDGFALVDVWELCTAYFVPSNDFNRGALERAMADIGHGPGVVARDERPEFGVAYRAAAAAETTPSSLSPRPLPTLYRSPLHQPVRLAIAGSAGQRVRSAGSLLAAAGVLSGLWSSRRDDHPITVRTGYSLAEVILSPTPIEYSGVPQPDVAVVLAAEGAARLRAELGRMSSAGLVYRIDELAEVNTPAQVRRLAFDGEARRHGRKNLSTLAVAAVVRDLELFPLPALAEAARRTQRPEIAAQNLAAIAAIGDVT